MRYFAFALASMLAGCVMTSTITSSSLDHMAAAQSGATSTHAPLDAAREVTRLFASRGYALGEEHPINATGGYAIRLTRTDRVLLSVSRRGFAGPLDVGSVFYVWIMPNATGSTITMVGKPTLNGAEPCSSATPGLTCSSEFETDPDFASNYLSGQAEADVAHGVLSELALEGFATGALPVGTPIIPGTPPDPVCEQQRHAAFARARATQDLDERAKLLQSAPACTG